MTTEQLPKKGSVQGSECRFTLFSPPNLQTDFVPWSAGEEGQQTFVKLHRNEEVGFLYAGVCGIMDADVQQSLMRLVNDGWVLDGETYMAFDGTKGQDLDGGAVVESCVLELGASLLPLVDPYQKAPLLTKLREVRQEITQSLGLVMPGINVRDNLRLHPSQYQLRIRDTVVSGGEMFLDRYLVMGNMQQLSEFVGWSTKDPTYHMAAKWIEPSQLEAAEKSGCMVVGPLSVLVTHVRELITTHAATLLGLQDTHALLSRLRWTHPIVVDEFLSSTRSIRKIRHLLQELLREGVSIRDLVTIMETVGDHANLLEDTESLTEKVRNALARAIVAPYLNEDRCLRMLVLSEIAEQRLERIDARSPEALEEARKHLTQALRLAVETFGHPRVLTVKSTLRRGVRQLTVLTFAQLGILALNEVPSDCHVEVAGQVGWGAHSTQPVDKVTPSTADTLPAPEQTQAPEEPNTFWKRGRKKKA